MADRTLRALIDTNVLVQNRWLAPIQDAAAAGYLVPIWSPSIISEANSYLTWRWIQRHGGDRSAAAKTQCSAAAKRWFARVSAVFRVAEDCPPHPDLWTPTPLDASDIPLWTAAVNGRCRMIVTENLKHGPPRDEDGLQTFRGIGMFRPEVLMAVVALHGDRFVGAELPSLEGGPPRPDPGGLAGWESDPMNQVQSLPPAVETFLAEVNEAFDPGSSAAP